MAYELMVLLTDEADLTLGRLAHLLGEEFASDPGAVVGLEEYPLTAMNHEKHEITRKNTRGKGRRSQADLPD